MENSSHSKMGKKGCTMTGGVTISIIVLLFVIGIPMMAAGVALLNVTSKAEIGIILLVISILLIAAGIIACATIYCLTVIMPRDGVPADMSNPQTTNTEPTFVHTSTSPPRPPDNTMEEIGPERENGNSEKLKLSSVATITLN